MISELKDRLSSLAKPQQMIASCSALSPGQVMAIAGVAGSLRAILVSLLHDHLRRQLLVVAADRPSAERMYDDIRLASGDSQATLLKGFWDTTHVPHEEEKRVADIAALRFLLSETQGIVITEPGGMLLRLPSPASMKGLARTVEEKKDTSFTEILRWLAGVGFEKKDFVETHGDYSVRGGILDVFAFVGEHPLRIEFFGDTIESIREFDPLSQRSIRELHSAVVVPNLLAQPSASPSSGSWVSLLDYLQKDAMVILEEPEMIKKTVGEEAGRSHLQNLRWEDMEELMGLFPRITIHAMNVQSKLFVDFESRSQPSFNGSIKILRRDLAALLRDKYAVTICCDTQSELARLKELLAEVDVVDEADAEREDALLSRSFDLQQVEFSLHALHEGFVLPNMKQAVYTEHQIFKRLKRRGRQRRPKFRGFSERELRQLRKGDYVVHIDFGIGKFDGLRRIRVGEIEQEVVKLTYDQNDMLYVNLNYINQIQKYSSREGHIPKLTRLGSTDWDRLKSRAKRRIKEIARDLIRLYGRRKASPGFVFEPDTPWQKELEASFPYEDTYDQARTTREVKQDMEAQYPMDRLVCGDVGFGKTEIAVRAAFKCVLSGKQVGLLVPTTILALQHYATFMDRVTRYSVKVEVLTRFKTKKEQARIIEDLKAGRIDIIIGTHRLLSKDVGFKDLGLLIIDEEHRFGVAAKEKLRQLKATVDTLTLTATPIPRTLHFSLLGARDLSIIATPPRNRLPVITEITQYSNDLIVEAVRRELHRNGQVYVVHDRVQTIGEMTRKLQALLPDVRIRSAHGQMPGHELEQVMVEFLGKNLDVLVCTKIIESGLDLPNVNTIIINRADRFGMAELYQLRGRVGRSNQQAYAYLLVPPLSVLPRSTLLRLQALEEFTELGSGFNLAMRDLEIRGAGNLLGSEQSGFIETMGFETYQRVLEEAVHELKEQEFQEFFEGKTERARLGEETVVEVECEALIPDTYVENDAERLEMYRRLYGVNSLEQLTEVTQELEDRFGKHPPQVTNLFRVIEIRQLAGKLGVRRARVGRHELVLEFPPETDIAFYDHADFQRLMERIGQFEGKSLMLRQAEGTLRLTKRLPSMVAEGDPLSPSIQFLRELSGEIASLPAGDPTES